MKRLTNAEQERIKQVLHAHGGEKWFNAYVQSKAMPMLLRALIDKALRELRGEAGRSIGDLLEGPGHNRL
jgi:hypothetical protein